MGTFFMSDSTYRGKFLLEHCAAQISPYPFSIAFVTTTDDWNAVIAHMHENDPGSKIDQYLNAFNTNSHYVNLLYKGEYWYIVGCRIADIPYNHFYTGVALGAVMDVAHNVIMDLSKRIGNDPTKGSTTTAIMHDWFLRSWRGSLCNLHDTYLVFIPDAEFEYLSDNPGVLGQVMTAQEQLGSSLAVTCALQRECQRLLNTQVIMHDDHWSTVTYLSGGGV